MGAAIEESRRDIPRHYKSWTLFLICNRNWFKANKQQDLDDLHSDFLSFGDVIGDDNLAVWLTKKHPTDENAIDVARNVAFCRRYDLAPSGGPYIVFTPKYPRKIQIRSVCHLAAWCLRLGEWPKTI